MTRYTRFVSAATLCALGAATFFLSASTVSRAGTTVVYRCLDARLGVVYTDVPCKEGASFDVRTGEADLEAVAKLERARDALDQSAAQRLADERRLAGQKELLAAQSRREAPDGRDGEDNFADGAYYTYPVAGYALVHPHRLHHRVLRPLMSRGGAPHPPYIVPRT